MKNRILVIGLLILAIALTSCRDETETKQNIEVNYSNLLDISNSNPEVVKYLEGEEYEVQISKVTDEDRNELPAVYEGLEEQIFKAHYKTNNFDLLVVMDKNEVLKVIPITSLKI